MLMVSLFKSRPQPRLLRRPVIGDAIRVRDAIGLGTGILMVRPVPMAKLPKNVTANSINSLITTQGLQPSFERYSPSHYVTHQC